MWSSTNIREKGWKIVPSRIESDASTAIIFIVPNIWITAATTHAVPCSIFWTIFSVVAVFACFSNHTTASSLPATAFSSKLSGRNNDLIPTIALAKPKDITINSFTDRSYSNQSPKSDVCDIYRSCGHRAAPSVRMSSSGIGVAASIPLRIVAGGLLRCLQ